MSRSTRTSFTFTIRLSAPAARKVTVAYRTVGGTATAGKDYLTRSGRLEIAAGASRVRLTVPVVADRKVERDERFTLRLSAPVGATIVHRIGQATIVTDD